MIVIEYPDNAHSIRGSAEAAVILDPVRRKWVRLTPEEWVRQNFLQYFLKVLRYPASLISVEKEIRVGELRKRYDIVVYDQDTQPWLLMECKQPSEEMGQAVLDQALRYHIAVPVRYLVISNGNDTYGWEKREGGLTEMSALPLWENA